MKNYTEEKKNKGCTNHFFLTSNIHIQLSFREEVKFYFTYLVRKTDNIFAKKWIMDFGKKCSPKGFNMMFLDQKGPTQTKKDEKDENGTKID